MEVITTVPKNKVLVIETISVNIRIPETVPLPQVARLAVVTGSAFPLNTGSPLIGDISNNSDGNRSSRELR